MKRTTALLLTSALLAAPLFAVPAMAADTGIVCVRLREISDTTVVDDKTILLKMLGGGAPYKRIDLAGPCTGIEFSGFSHLTHDDELCNSDTIVARAGGGTCKIQSFTDLSAAEGRALTSMKK